MTKKFTVLKTMLLAIVMMVGSGNVWAGAIPNTPNPYLMSSGDYSEAFTNIANATKWPSNFNGTDCTEWTAVAVNATGAIGDGVKTIVTTTTFYSGTSGGVQRGTANLVLLAPGPTDNTNAVAVDLYLNFTGRNAGTLSFDWAEVANSTGDRKSSLKIYTSTDGITFAELTDAAVLNVTNNVVSSGSISSIALPASFNNAASVIIRFYVYNATGGTTGSRAKISIDNVAVTSTSGVATPSLNLSTSSLSGFAYNYGSGPSVEQSFTVSGANLTNDVAVELPTKYEISTGTGASFVAANVAIPITMATANAGSTTIYTRLKAGLAVGAQVETISISSTDATTKTVACTGSVACVSSGLAFGTTSVNKSVGDVAFTQVATSANTAAITYTSSVPATADVDINTGEVTIKTAGTTIITATQGAGSGYCATTANYTLNVAPVDPTISVVETSVPAMVAVVGSTDAKTITVSGTNLTSDISLALSGTNADQFSLSTETVTQSGGTAANTLVTITYTPTVQASHVATLTLSSGTATPVVYSLTGDDIIKDSQTITFISLANKIVGDATFTLAATASSSLSISYVSSNENVATISGATITIVGAGSTNITASQTGNDIFNAAPDVITAFNVLPTQTAGNVIITEVYGGGGNSGANYKNDFIELYNTTEANIDLSGWSVVYYSATTVGLAANIFEIPAGKTIGAYKYFLIQAAAGTGGTIDLPTPDAISTLALSGTSGKIILNVTKEAQTISDLASITGNKYFKDYVPFGTTAVPVFGSVTTNLTSTTSASRKKSSGSYLYTSNVGLDFEVVTPNPQNSGFATMVDVPLSNLSVSTLNGKIQLNAAAGETVKIYNAIGQQLLSKVAVEGLNTIAVAARGVVIVKVGNRVAKVIM